MSPRRADDALTWLLDRGLLREEQVREPQNVAWLDVERVHPPRWIESLDDPKVLAQVLGLDVGPALPVSALLEMFRRASGGTVAAARWAVRTRSVAANLMGGFHHAHPEKGVGFCPINDVAMAIKRLRHEGFLDKITVLDLDAHPPDGIASCLEGEDDVQILSLGVASGWAAGAGVLDRRLPSMANDATYLAELDALLEGQTPGKLTFYLAGADPLVGDRFGGLAVTPEGLRLRDRRVFRWLDDHPAVILPAGGYTDEAWRVLAGTVAEAVGSREPVNPKYDPVYRRTLDIYRTLDPEQLKGDFALSFQDLAADLGGAPRDEPRFLHTYTRHGLEYALERYGLLPAVRRMGFVNPQIELSCGEMPHRLRIVSPVEGQPQALADLALTLKRMDGWNTLFIEWLELRDPRAKLPDNENLGRGALPGQRHPGLGLASETVHLLLRTAQRLGLDAIALTPAWYHIAWMVRDEFQALDPEEEGRFRALVEALGEVPLHQATTQLHGPGLPTAEGPLTWRPLPRVRPITQAMTEALKAQQPQVQAAYERWRARLAAPVDPVT